MKKIFQFGGKLFVIKRRRRGGLRKNRAAYLKHREEARTFIHARVAELNQHYGLRYNRITIKDQKSRWGSCSRQGNLNFNYKLLFLPSHIADYIIVHELCHLREMNHSRNFWGLVAQTVPDYHFKRKELREIILDI